MLGSIRLPEAPVVVSPDVPRFAWGGGGAIQTYLGVIAFGVAGLLLFYSLGLLDQRAHPEFPSVGGACALCRPGRNVKTFDRWFVTPLGRP